MKYLFLGLFLLLSVCLKAQETRFHSGYIITASKDTIQGEIMLRTDEQNSKSCIFRENPQSEEQHFSPAELHSYHSSTENTITPSK